MELSLNDQVSTELIALFCDIQDDAELANRLIDIYEKIGQLNVTPLPGTRMICSSCYAVNAPGYKLRRSAGKYLALCVDETGGCAGKELYPKCSFIDHIGVECDQLAEYQIMFGEDELITRYACIAHAGVLLKDTKNTVHPIR
jgi:hypothetical protein